MKKSAGSSVLIKLLLINLLWVPVNLSIRVAINGGFSPMGLATARWIAFPAAMWIALAIPMFRRATGFGLPSVPDRWRAVLIGAALNSPAHILYYFALPKTTTLEANVLSTTAPIWTGLLAYFILRERESRKRWLAIGIGLTGAYIVTAGIGAPKLAGGHTAANLVYLVGVVTECVSLVLSAKLVRRSSGIGVLAYNLLGSAIAFAVFAPLLSGSLPVRANDLTLGAELALAYLVCGAGLVGFISWFALMPRSSVSFMALSLLIQPPLVAFLGWCFLGEILSPSTVLGSILVISALYLASRDQSKHNLTSTPLLEP